MVRDIPAHVITDVRDPSKNSGNPAFAHLNLCPVPTIVLLRNGHYCTTLLILWGIARWKLRLGPLKFFYVQL